ncbi:MULTISPECIES: c-type cytochrome [Flavobacterium]|uniref:C-type cytochrome n=1 Tax=Flavobacterium jumunjinense TaxID=998845 RepID=A0ABV5GTQ6_9FLAO|nr:MULTISPECIES: c-type cytochrome [Flavobacterium]
MKKTVMSLTVTATLLLISCGQNKEQENFGKSTEEQTVSITEATPNPLINEGKELFEGKGTCVACHNPDKKIIGPSIKEIANLYKTTNSNIVAFLKEESDPIVDPSQYEIMKTNFSITKKMSDKELQALESYILSYAD